MSADFWAGYASGAVGILIGNPLDLLKVRLQAGDLQAARYLELNKFTSLVKGFCPARHADLEEARINQRSSEKAYQLPS